LLSEIQFSIPSSRRKSVFDLDKPIRDLYNSRVSKNQKSQIRRKLAKNYFGTVIALVWSLSLRARLTSRLKVEKRNAKQVLNGVPPKFIGTSSSFVQGPGHILEVAGKFTFHSLDFREIWNQKRYP
jgi:CRISPR/Cas system CSM-associated protein Csm5 (group 7 of RAMP superfamily)